MDKKQMLKRSRLWAAFKMLDTDGSGKISFEEVKTMLSDGATGLTEDDFKDMVKEIDVDGDGQIDFEEFEKMMLVLVKEHDNKNKKNEQQDRDSEIYGPLANNFT